MIRETVVTVLQNLGVLPAAVEDGVARAERCFGNGSPTDAELNAWAERLRTEAPHFFGASGGHTQAPSLHTQIPDWLSPSEKLARARQLGLAPVHDKQARRPQPYVPSAAQQRELDAIINPAERITKYRAMRAEAQQ